MSCDVTVILIVIRGLAAILFLVFYLNTREQRHLTLSAGWILYAVSGAIRYATVIDPVRYWSIVGVTSVGGIALLVLVALSYLRPRLLRLTVPVLLLTLLVAAGLFVSPRPIDAGTPLFILQAFTMTAPIAVYIHARREVRRLFPRPWTFLIVSFSVSVVYALVVAFVDFPLTFKVIGTATLNALLVSLFAYTEHELILSAARRAAMRLSSAEESVGIGLWERGPADTDATWSSGHFRVFGLPEEDTPAPTWPEFLSMVHPEDRGRVREAFVAAGPDNATETLSYRIRRPDGELRWISSRAVTDTDGNAYGIVVDITDLKTTEERLAQSLSEKDTLIAEIHHRVKNNLQIMSSMFQLQFDAISDPLVREHIDRIDARLHAMSAVQELLLEVDDLNDIDMELYVHQVSDYTLQLVRRNATPVQFSIDAGGVRFTASTAIVVGSMISELLTCIMETSRARSITVRLSREKRDYRVSVRADVSAFADETAAGTSLSVALVRTLAAQLRGTFAASDDGRGAEIVFPDPRSR